MTKQQFLEELKKALSGEVSPEAMMDAYSYYSGYIDEQMQSGKTEEQVIEELGKPFMIARSIIAAQEHERTADVEYTEDGRTRKVRDWENRQANREEKEVKREFTFDMNCLVCKAFTDCIFDLLILIVFFILKVGLWVLFTFGVPILIVLESLFDPVIFSENKKF